LPTREIDALDVGCGTGIVTYALATFCRSVTGVDKEQEMIKEAKLNAPNNCNFLVSPAETLPFSNASFNLITVAQAFHWFDHEKTLAEFRRVIRPASLIVIFRKRAKDGIRILADFVWPILGKYVDRTKLQQNQNDFSNLRNACFASCEVINIPYEELYTSNEYLGFLQSHSVYNLVPENQREAYLEDMRQEIENHLEKGLIVIKGIVEMWFLHSQ
ncbi:class I SAM-dependent methyltransferase, partial [archaeon]|nr:class I SAM-dependent methyltransferase [archaeon]